MGPLRAARAARLRWRSGPSLRLQLLHGPCPKKQTDLNQARGARRNGELRRDMGNIRTFVTPHNNPHTVLHFTKTSSEIWAWDGQTLPQNMNKVQRPSEPSLTNSVASMLEIHNLLHTRKPWKGRPSTTDMFEKIGFKPEFRLGLPPRLCTSTLFQPTVLYFLNIFPISTNLTCYIFKCMQTISNLSCIWVIPINARAYEQQIDNKESPPIWFSKQVLPR